MGAIHKLIHDIGITSRRIGGATCSQVTRKRHGKIFADWYNKNAQRPASRLSEIDVKLLPDFVRNLSGSRKVGTVNNFMASVRQLLRVACVDLTGYEKNVSVYGAKRSRCGTKEPYPDNCLPELWARAQNLHEGFYHIIRIERLLGCRGLEALMSSETLRRWIEELEYLGAVSILTGTKGGRPRFTEVLAARVDETRDVILGALEYLRTHTYFIEGKTAGLKAARAKYHRLAVKIGLIGKYSPHSLRYAYATEKILEMKDLGFSRREILSHVSTQLGHGRSRGRWVKSVYGQSVAHLLPKPTKTVSDLFKLANELRNLPIHRQIAGPKQHLL